MSKSQVSKFSLTMLCFAFMTIIIISPQTYLTSALNGLVVWANNVVPALFPFFVITKIINSLNLEIKMFNRFSKKMFHTPTQASNVFFMSLLSGYPVGAMMIANLYEQNCIDKLSASKMFSYCSTSGPIFIVGTIAVGMFKNSSVGYVLLLAHIIGAVINGFVFRGKKIEDKTDVIFENQQTSLYDNMYNSILSILFVGGYIVISFVAIDMLNALNIIPAISNVASDMFGIADRNIIKSVLNGTLEITRGCLDLSKLDISLKLKTILTSSLISFSGLCIFFQSMTFLNKIGIKKSTMFKYKLTQCLLTTIITMIFVFLFL